MSNDRDVQPQQTDEGGGPAPYLVVAIVLAVAMAVFIIQNRDPTGIEFLFLDFNSRLWIILLLAMALGAALDRLFIAWWRRRKANRD